MRPERYAEIQFESSTISFADFLDFTGDHLARLAEYNGKVDGKFDELVADTKPGLEKAIVNAETLTAAANL